MGAEHHYKLKRELGLWEISLSGIGIILGAGIYALIGKAAGLAGNGVWMAFLLAAMLAALTGLSYAELSSLFPKSGAEYVYTRKSFGAWVAFLVGWMVIFAGVIGAAAVALGFAGYFAALFATPVIPAALLLIIGLSFVILWGIKQSARIAVAFTLIEAAGLFFIIAIGIPHFGSVNLLEVPPITSLFSAAALIFFAFIGFEEMVRLSEETKNPQKTMPRALLIAIVSTTIIYILVAISAVSILSPAELAVSASPVADVASAAIGADAFLLISVIALFSTTNTVLLMLLASSRITYGIARDRCLPSFLGRVHPKRRTPHFAILLVMILSLIVVLAGDITLIANVTNFTIYITFIVINLSVIALRYKSPGKRKFKVPLSIGRFPLLPLLGAITSGVMLFSLGLDILLYGVVLLVVGWIFYKVISRKGMCKLKGR
ncbi:MAG: amino acid permease [Candidatus Aenigmarchaeota archaeon]|nr:amino acid permease [Candidatus Aenigmarchaeota archaeon]